MSIPFEETRSYVYRATRYEILPTIERKAVVYGDEPFLLRDLSKEVLAERYTDEQLETQINSLLKYPDAAEDRHRKVRL